MRRILQKAESAFRAHPKGAPAVYMFITFLVVSAGGSMLLHLLEASSATSLINAIKGYPVAKAAWADWQTVLWESCLVLLLWGTLLAGMVYGWSTRGARSG
jgi:hypothetical protein